MAKALLTDGLLSVFPAADACPADLRMVGKLLTVPAFCAQKLFCRGKSVVYWGDNPEDIADRRGY